MRTSDRATIANLIQAQVMPLLSNFAVALSTAAFLGPAGRGELALMVTSANLLAALTFGSVHVGVVAEYRRGEAGAIAAGKRIGNYLAAFLLVGAGTAGTLGISGTLDAKAAWTAAIIFIAAAAVAHNLILLRIVQGLGEDRVYRNAWLVQSAGYAAIAIPLAICTRSPVAVVTCWVTVVCVSSLMVRPTLSRLSRHANHTSSSPRQIFRVAAPAHLGVMGQQFLFRADILILALFATDSQVGVYSVAAPIAGVGWSVTEALSLAAFGSITAVGPAEARKRFSKMTLIHFRVGALVAAIVFLGSLLVPQVLNGYGSVPLLVALLLPGILIQGVARIGLSVLLTSGFARQGIRVGLVSALLAGVYVPATYFYGTIGAAVASTVVYTAQAMVVAWILRQRLSVKLRARESDRKGAVR